MLPVALQSDIKYFLCLQCGARFEEELYDELEQEIYCMTCESVHIMPFRASAQGQTGCSAEGCGRRIGEGEQRGCGSGCGSGGCGQCG